MCTILQRVHTGSYFYGLTDVSPKDASKSDIDKLCFALTFGRCWNVYQDFTKAWMNFRPRLIGIGDYAKETDLPSSVLALYDKDEDQRLSLDIPHIEVYTSGAHFVTMCRQFFQRIVRRIESKQTDLDEALLDQNRLDGHIFDLLDRVRYYGDWRLYGLPFASTPDLVMLCNWLRRATYGKLEERLCNAKKIPDNAQCVSRNVDRKEFILSSSIEGLKAIVERKFVSQDLSLAHALLVLICRTSDPSISMNISDETTEAITKGPWAGEAVDIIPLRDFLAQFRSEELLSKDWRNVAEDVMSILVEIVEDDGGFDWEDPELATALDKEVEKLSQPWSTIEDLLAKEEEIAEPPNNPSSLGIPHHSL